MSTRNGAPTPALRGRRGPSRGFWIGMGAVGMFALVLTGIGAVGAAWDIAPAVPEESSTPVPTVQISHAPRPTTPPDNVTLDFGE